MAPSTGPLRTRWDSGRRSVSGLHGGVPDQQHALQLNWTRMVSSSVLNEASFGWVRPWGELLNPRPDIPGVTVTGHRRMYQVGWGPTSSSRTASSGGTCSR